MITATNWQILTSNAFAKIDAGLLEMTAKRGTEQEVVETQPRVALPIMPHVVPESVDALTRMLLAQRTRFGSK